MYLTNDPLNDVEKLITIGTPNQGSPIANWTKIVPSDMTPLFGEFLYAPAIYDLIPGSNATRSQIHNGTTYYTIAGNWTPLLIIPLIFLILLMIALIVKQIGYQLKYGAVYLSMEVMME